ncbi:MAG: formylglycine-generating enzyme family protein [Planctomycetaceae bacterium]|jgi:formylglycine-generating enzyme required for sulfatase activity|nr:formylglycine-generating enzyme family protein [Planctomycetaceae bacterium]
MRDPRRILLSSALLCGVLSGLNGCSDRSQTAPPTRASDAADESDQAGGSLVKEPSADAPEGMVWIPGGTFMMGSRDSSEQDAYPPHRVDLDGFWMDTCEVTNAQFQRFVGATGYVTAAEKKPDLSAVRKGSKRTEEQILPELNRPGSICLIPNLKKEDLDPNLGAYAWWQYVPGANWRHPEGPGTSIADLMSHPVVHVSWHDVQAYCRWAGKRLPSEAQWEYAARGGLEGAVFPWGNQRNPDKKWLHNIYQGDFPVNNTIDDGFKTTAPVGSFPANGYGLFDMSGNIWEWVQDNYTAHYYDDSPRRNPPGPESSLDPDEPDILKRVQRGGSFMCSDTYCRGYRVAARMKGEESSGLFHTGFRCVVPHDAIAAYRKANPAGK